jgi:hypothetical protein
LQNWIDFLLYIGYDLIRYFIWGGIQMEIKTKSPVELYILPVQELTKPYIPIDRIGKYSKKIDADFFFDQESGQLR